MRDLDVTGQAQELGQITNDTGEVAIQIAGNDPAVQSVTYVGVESDEPSQVWQQEVACATPVDPGSGKWLAKDVPVGSFRVKAQVSSDWSFSVSAPVHRAPGAKQSAVTLRVPRANATLTVRFSGTTPGEKTPRYVELRTEDGTLQTSVVAPASHTAPAVTRQLPAGTWRVIEGANNRPRTDVPPIVLGAGESKTIDMPLQPAEKAGEAEVVQLRIWSAGGVLVQPASPVRVSDSGGKVIESMGEGALGALYRMIPGTYRVEGRFPGNGPAWSQPITIAAPDSPSAPAGRGWPSVDVVLR